MRGFYRRFGKRLFDLVVAFLGLVLLSPVMILTSILVFFRLGRPVIFRQSRPGRGGTPFEMRKFRTMTSARGADGELLSDAERLTPFGRRLRETSLDELPELWNVLRGEMSLVGPRPLLHRYVPFFTEQERRRFDVAPGITGLAQVSGRNDLAWDDRLALDIQYVESLSFSLDLRILFMTIKKVFVREGLRSDPGAAMLDLDEERRRRGVVPTV